ncbi:hypothetical protein [Dyadobacter frigoris]|uniref:Lipocalin-like domain-containing protein n=1 Tax=Dyadobacter frigoris TaxID=2576211 RepID=A0A4U6DB08_9BACT|nr:hypothetical protein [Dyadobacter frigoris]TKT91494.1 hypothetical protein FDK13_14065 [Dyadobacter frigoris]GLU51949.1 hypothetical protein Dfri01_14100 [Dyadobacter frigoris]
MKRLFYIPLLFIFLFNCKNDKIDARQDEIIKPIVGQWRLTEIEQEVKDKKIWQPVDSITSQYLVFRSDGVMFDKNGIANCCGPKELSINGASFRIKPKTKVNYDHCAAANCAYCAVMDIEYSGDQMIITNCNPVRFKYIKN